MCRLVAFQHKTLRHVFSGHWIENHLLENCTQRQAPHTGNYPQQSQAHCNLELEQEDCNSAQERPEGSLLVADCNCWNLTGKWVSVLVGYNQMMEEKEHCMIALVGYN